jgi:hypothetical protein
VIAVAVLLAVAMIVAGVYLYRIRGPLPGSAAGVAPDILSQLPPEAPAIAYIDVRALRGLQDSSWATVLGLSNTDPHADPDYKRFVSDTGFDYSRDLDSAAIAFWPTRLPTSSSGPLENPVVAIGDGRFDQQKIKAYALRSGKTVARGRQRIYEVPGSPAVAFEFVSSSRIFLAGGPDTEKFLFSAHSAKRDPDMQSRIDRVAGSPIFAVARTDNLPPSFYDNLKSVPQFEILAHSVKALSFAGQPEGSVIHVTLDAECDSMTDAMKLSTFLDGLRILGAIALSDSKTRRQFTPEQLSLFEALINQTKVTHQDHWVRLRIDITAAMLEDASPRSAANR